VFGRPRVVEFSALVKQFSAIIITRKIESVLCLSSVYINKPVGILLTSSWEEYVEQGVMDWQEAEEFFIKRRTIEFVLFIKHY
jgi:hypothetical protein